MNPVFGSLLNRWYETIMMYVPGIVGALIILIIGWIVGRLLGRAVRIVLDKISEQHIVEEGADVVSIRGSFKNAGVTVGYIGDIAVRIVVYLIAVLAAVDVLKLDYLSQLMMMIVEYIPHVVAFVIIFVVGFILIDTFIDFLNRVLLSKECPVHLISPGPASGLFVFCNGHSCTLAVADSISQSSTRS